MVNSSLNQMGSELVRTHSEGICGGAYLSTNSLSSLETIPKEILSRYFEVIALNIALGRFLLVKSITLVPLFSKNS